MQDTSTLPRPPRHKWRSESLVWFVLFSLGLHLLLLWGWRQHSNPMQNIEPLRTAMNITLQVSTPSPVTKPNSLEENERSLAETPAPRPTQSPSQLEEKIAPPPEKKTEQAQEANAGPALTTETKVMDSRDTTTIEHEALRRRAVEEIRLALARHFSYPRPAQKRGWQGEVMLSFQLQPDGRIHDARIAHSSGYGMLDRAALKALEKVKRLELKTAYSFTLQIPVIYRLEG